MAQTAPSSPAAPLQSRARFLLSQLGARSSHQFGKRLEPLGIRPAHFGLLVHLSHHEGRSQQQLADLMDIHRNAMVGLVDDLERRGLIERRRHPTDRRAHAIHLTSSALELLPRAQELADQQEAELFTGVDQSDRDYLVRMLQRLAERGGLSPGVHPNLRADVPPDPSA